MMNLGGTLRRRALHFAAGAVAILVGVWLVRNFQWDVVWETAPFLLRSLGVSWILAITSVVIGLCAGICLAAARLYGFAGLRHVAVLYIELIRSVPQIMVLFWVFLGLPQITGYVLGPWPAATIALSLIASAYLAEVVRAGLLSVPKVHQESGYVTGLQSSQIFFYIVMPQALRNMLPALVAHAVMIFKLTSLVYLVGLVDFFRASILVNNRDFAPYPIYLTMAIVYLVCNLIMSMFIKRFDPKYSISM